METELEVTHLDGSKETVKVRSIPPSKIQALVIALANEAVLIELYCDKPEGWADSLTIESVNAIADKGQELNRLLLSAWLHRQKIWNETFATNGK